MNSCLDFAPIYLLTIATHLSFVTSGASPIVFPVSIATSGASDALDQAYPCCHDRFFCFTKAFHERLMCCSPCKYMHRFRFPISFIYDADSCAAIVFICTQPCLIHKRKVTAHVEWFRRIHELLVCATLPFPAVLSEGLHRGEWSIHAFQEQGVFVLVPSHDCQLLIPFTLAMEHHGAHTKRETVCVQADDQRRAAISHQ
jgi:hypothetical protein